jgi:hypothetical protein
LEFAFRLRQLNALIERIELLNEYVIVELLPDGHYRRERWKGGIPAPFSVWMPHSEELLMWADSFYLLAWRALEIADQTEPKAFFGMPRIAAVGVRDVRNRLLQHPEVTALAQAWSFSPDDGPIIKPTHSRPGSAAPDDPGLFVNARELRTNLDRAFTRAVQVLQSDADVSRPAV